MGAGLESLEAMGKWVNIRAVDTDPHGFAWSRIYFPSCVLIQDGKGKIKGANVKGLLAGTPSIDRLAIRSNEMRASRRGR